MKLTNGYKLIGIFKAPYAGAPVEAAITLSANGLLYSVECESLGWCTNGHKYIGDAIKEFEMMLANEEITECEINQWIVAAAKLVEKCLKESKNGKVSTYMNMLEAIDK